MAMINRTTFEVNGAFDTGRIYGTVEVTIAGETRRVRASMSSSDSDIRFDQTITAFGITGRYATGTKAWPGHIRNLKDGAEHVSFGFDSRSGKHRKVSISFGR